MRGAADGDVRPRTGIILAAGEVPSVVSTRVGRGSPALLPIQGRPLLHRSLEYLAEVGLERVVVGVRQDDLPLARFLEHAGCAPIRAERVVLEEDRGPGYTLLRCLEHLEAEEPVLVVLGDTLFRFSGRPWEGGPGSFVLTSPVSDADRWCLAEVDARRRVTALADKPASNPGGWPALIGVYYLDSPAPACAALRRRLAERRQPLELRHALEPYVQAGTLRADEAGEWYDCGHPDNLASTRRRMLPARDFNTVQLDVLRGTVTKSSRDGATLLDEIDYYAGLPEALRIFFPRVVAQDRDPSAPWLTLEYYPHATLSELWVCESMEAHEWEGVFAALARILDCLAGHVHPLPATATREVYWDKTVSRMEALARQDHGLRGIVTAREVRLNGVRLRGWPALADEVHLRVSAMRPCPHGCVIHGDLCFPNILYEPATGAMKFVDPRGRFGTAGVYGDPRYDLAKLMHSIEGGYDQLVQGLFRVEARGADLSLLQAFPGNRAGVLAAFEGVFGGRADPEEIRLIQGLLFVSMAALHTERPARQLSMYLRGIQLLNDGPDPPATATPRARR